MVTEVRIYIEGGGNDKYARTRLREGFSKFFDTVVTQAREHRIGWSLILCGSRNATFDAFKQALSDHSHAFNVLLVDAEEPVTHAPWLHLMQRDRWERPAHVTDEHCHLMVQCMEAWLIADVKALQAFYGQSFSAKPLFRTQDIETVAKDMINKQLEQATKGSQKNVYHKIHHGGQLLARIDPAVVRKASVHCDRLFNALESKVTK